MSAIYTKVRHRLNDDWAYGNGKSFQSFFVVLKTLKKLLLTFLPDVDSRPWDFQAEECSLRSAVDRFNHRRYQKELPTNQQMQQSQEKANTTESPAFGQEVSFMSSDGSDVRHDDKCHL